MGTSSPVMWTATRRSIPPSSLPPTNTTGSISGRRRSPPATSNSAASSPSSHRAGLTPSPCSSRLATWHMQQPLRPTTTTGFSATIRRIPLPSTPLEEEAEEEEEEDDDDDVVGDVYGPSTAGGVRSFTAAHDPVDPYGTASGVIWLFPPFLSFGLVVIFDIQVETERERE
ncbi:unnamed protein product, partial [Musa acuminata subsp. burmannicoides]